MTLSGNQNKTLVAPSILACDLANLQKEIQDVETAGADVLHFDVMDGHFVPNISFGLPLIQKARKHTKLPIDAHLMIENADQFLDEFKKVGCDWISVHVEACPHLHRTLSKIQELGMKAGVAINPGTALSRLDSVLSLADYVLIMSVNPGFGGQSFIEESLDRVKELRQRYKKPIQIDGGIKKENAGRVISAGAEILVVGTGIFGQKDYQSTIQEIRAGG